MLTVLLIVSCLSSSYVDCVVLVFMFECYTGHEYIEEARNESGVAVGFYCKLCDCKFTDPNAKLMHMKGRRHRSQYKV